MKRTDVRYQAPRRTFVNEAIISESLIGHPVLRIFIRIKISRIEITNWKNFTKRRARVKSLSSRCRFSCHIFPHRFSIYEPLVHRFAIEPREPRETRDRKRVSSFHRDDAGTFSHVRVSRRVQQRKEKTKRCSNVRTAFYFNALSTVHVVRGGRKRKRVYATLSTRKRWLTDRQALPILRV